MKAGQGLDDLVYLRPDGEQVRGLAQRLEKKCGTRPRGTNDQDGAVEPVVSGHGGRLGALVHEARRCRCRAGEVTFAAASAGASAGPKISESQTPRSSSVLLSSSSSPAISVRSARHSLSSLR